MADVDKNESSTSNPVGDRSEVGARARETAEQAQSKAAEVKDHAVDAAGDVAQQARTEAASVADDARHEAQDLMSEARHQLSAHADETTRSVVSTIAGTAEELRTMADRAEHPDSPAAQATRELAVRTEGLANRLESGGYRGVADDLARFGRNNPGVFLLAAGIAGFAVGRLLRNTDTGELMSAAKSESAGNGARPAMPPAEDRPPTAPAMGRAGRVEEPVVLVDETIEIEPTRTDEVERVRTGRP